MVYRFTQKYCSAFKILCQYFFKKIFEKEKVNGCAKKESKMVFFVTICRKVLIAIKYRRRLNKNDSLDKSTLLNFEPFS
ncbi:hypothetical protein ETT44_06745 [Streptococcus pyogenes]|nr:hypothetical protein ETT44_06745 [Streptococcus pyogenes]